MLMLCLFISVGSVQAHSDRGDQSRSVADHQSSGCDRGELWLQGHTPVPRKNADPHGNPVVDLYPWDDDWDYLGRKLA